MSVPSPQKLDGINGLSLIGKHAISVQIIVIEATITILKTIFMMDIIAPNRPITQPPLTLLPPNTDIYIKKYIGF